MWNRKKPIGQGVKPWRFGRGGGKSSPNIYVELDADRKTACSKGKGQRLMDWLESGCFTMKIGYWFLIGSLESCSRTSPPLAELYDWSRTWTGTGWRWWTRLGSWHRNLVVMIFGSKFPRGLVPVLRLRMKVPVHHRCSWSCPKPSQRWFGCFPRGL